MPVLKYLADTNVISDSMRGSVPVTAWLEGHVGEVAISTLTLAELRMGIELKEEGKVRRELQRQFDWILEDYEESIWLFDEAAAFEWGRLVAEARGHPLPFDDSLIGAIARSMGATVLTRNVRHFPGCRTVNPWTGNETAAWEPSP